MRTMVEAYHIALFPKSSLLAKQNFLSWLTIHQVKNQLKKTAKPEVKCTATSSSLAGGAAAVTPFKSTTTTLST